jgi:osmoprotectant transport system ATP-binding protein
VRGTFVGSIVCSVVGLGGFPIAFCSFHVGCTIGRCVVRHAASRPVCFQTSYRWDTVALVAEDSGPAVEFDQVCYSRPPAGRVLDGVSLTIRAGTVAALVGRSGAGKSTMLRLVNGLLMPERGTVNVHGRPTTEWNLLELRRGIGYVLQEVGLFPHLTVEENVAVVPSLLKWDTSAVLRRSREMLQLVGLDPASFGSRSVRQLSGGQRQRIGVARALAADPPLLLMDEPFGALDPVTRSELHREFREIQQRLRKTVIIVTHDMAEAFALADTVGVLADGRLAAVAPPRELARSRDPRVTPLLAPLAEIGAVLSQP